jgi:hypothetical protein
MLHLEVLSIKSVKKTNQVHNNNNPFGAYALFQPIQGHIGTLRSANLLNWLIRQKIGLGA